MNFPHSRRGFTLIEILIVVVIIALLASTVLIGLGSVSKKGRDARRISDLKSVQSGLELYFTKNGCYPTSSGCAGTGAMGWTALQAALQGAGIGVNTVPNDPRSGQNYLYGSNGTSYQLGATLEDDATPALNSSDHTNNLIDCSAHVTYCVTP